MPTDEPDDLDVDEVIARHDLEPHPEGGWYRRIWTSDEVVDDATGRRAGSAILFLLGRGQGSRWHRVVDADERWEVVAGGPAELEISLDASAVEVVVLDAEADALVPAGAWQRTVARAPTLCRCTVTPEFRFDGFEMAEQGWEPRPDPR